MTYICVTVMFAQKQQTLSLAQSTACLQIKSSRVYRLEVNQIIVLVSIISVFDLAENQPL